MPDHTGAVIEAQVDWLTVSAHGEDASDRLIDLAHGLAGEEKQKGNRERPFRLMGYEGTHIGAVEYGRRDNASGILRLIGNVANEHMLKALSVADAVTRIDLATTWRAEPPDPMIGRNTYAMAEWFHQKHPRSAMPSRIQDAAGGETVYLGRRESEYFLRVYNKGAECIATGDDQGAERYRACWRYELEIKGALSQAVATLVADHPAPSTYVQNYLYTYCEAHGVAPPFVADGPQKLLPGFRRRSDADSRIRHLARNVRPTVDWLRDQGELERALDALGLVPL